MEPGAILGLDERYDRSMVGGILRVFISSASGQLAPYRLAAVDVCHRLGLVPVHMEEFDPQRPTPEQVCQRMVESCDAFVLLLAHRYGSRPAGQQLSYTELEYRWAMNRPQMSIVAFVVDPLFSWPREETDSDADADADSEQLKEFVSSVRSNHIVRKFGELAPFREDLLLALSRQRPVRDSWAADEEWGSAPIPTPPTFHAAPPYVGSIPFTGRSGDLDLLDDWARSADPVLVVEAIGGAGKSAMTWQWAQDRAPAAIPGLAGRLWWSFYEGSASMTRFLQELIVYTSGRPIRHVKKLGQAELADMAIASMREHPYLVVLDGFERLLAAYQRFDPSKLRDEEVDTGQRLLIEPQTDDIVRRFAAAGPSKIMISTRLMPTALQSRSGQQIPGVQHLRLPGLTDADTSILLARLGVHGNESAITGFFSSLGNHPLLIGIIAGLVADYRPEPGGFDRWLEDPAAGGALRVPGLDLTQRSTHILAAALDGLGEWPRQLLGWFSALAGTVSWSDLEGINKYQPKPPAPIQPNLDSLGPRPTPPDEMRYLPWGEQAKEALRQYEAKLEAWNLARSRLIEQARRKQLAEWQATEPVGQARVLLDSALKDLEDRGLLWWDRSCNSYDLHPIVRSHVYGQLEAEERIQANDWIRDHFEKLPVENLKRISSVEDLKRTITIYRALVGGGHVAEASALWRGRMARVLQHNLGAHNTVVELLTPIAEFQAHLNIDLAISYWFMGRYDEAIRHETSILAVGLREESHLRVMFSLGNLSLTLRDAGSIAAASRCCDLRNALNAAVRVKPDGTLNLYRAMLASIKGEVKQARMLLNTAQQQGPTGQGLWHSEHIEYWRFYLALTAGRSLTHDEIDEARGRTLSWQHRRDLAALKYELFLQEEQYEKAMAAANEQERLARNAGLDVAPAQSALLLAMLGRTTEAAAAVEESLTRLPRIHPARFPHYRVAQTLWQLERPVEAAAHAYAAYKQAWCDGPPHFRYWELRQAHDLLQAMQEPIPDLPVMNTAGSLVPLEDEIVAFLEVLKSAPR